MERYIFTVVAYTVLATVLGCDVVPMTFPPEFRLGTASSAYQIEGAWNVGGKSLSNWDYFTYKYPDRITDSSDGKVACNSYYKYKEDVQIIKSIGFEFYRFSVSWSRILPNGFTNVINEEGLQYYKNLTAELVANGIEPIVTIYHFDHPHILDEMGGWTNELMIDWFVAYARVLFRELGGSVKRWVTINEPNSICANGYERGQLAPGARVVGIAGYICGHNVLKAHALTYRMYDKEFREAQQGFLSVVVPIRGYIPRNSTDTQAVETVYQFANGWFLQPIYQGDYPDIMKTKIAMISELQGYPRSRLPTFSDEWIDIIRGTYDYFGFNHYTSNVVHTDPDEKLGIYKDDIGVILEQHPNWEISGSAWLSVYPPGISQVLRQIRDLYNNPPVWIMENGYSDTGELEDYKRISYYYEYLREVLIALKRDNCNVEGYCAWSIMDNFEWHAGYSERYGIVSVDFNDPERPRTFKSSTRWWSRVASKRKLQPVPTNTNTRKR